VASAGFAIYSIGFAIYSITCANVNARLGEWRAVNANYYGDYYPLTPYAPGDDAWVGWQFDRPEVGAG